MLGEAPGKREDDSGKPFVGRAGQLLDDMLETVGLSRNKLFITNAVSCRPPDNRTPRKREIDACRHWLNYQIKQVQPKYIALLGNVALEAALGVKGIRKLRGRAIEKDGIVYLPMYHPSYILRGDSAERPIAEQDLKYFKEIIDFGGVPEERALDFTIVDTWKKVDEMLDALTSIVSADIETTSLYPWAPNARVVSLGLGTSVGEFIVPIFHRESKWTDKDIACIIEQVGDRLDDCTTVMHNGKFDALWLKVHYGAQWRNDFDTMLAHYLLDENSRHGLDHLATVYFGAPNWDIPLAEKQGGAPFATIAKYHAHDVYYTRKLYAKLRRELAKDPQVERVFDKLLMPCANLFVEMEERGAYIDMAKMKDVEKYLRTEMDVALKRLGKWGEINWGSPQQVAGLLYGKLKIKCPLRTKKGAYSSSESALKMIDHPCVSDLLKYRGHKQQLSFFVEGWKPYIHDKRIHPSFKLHGTVTGRLSSEHPNFQQVPRDTRIRSLVTAPPGWTLVEADLSQIELRIIAELSGVASMREAFANGEDIHWKTALGELERYVGQPKLVTGTAQKAKNLGDKPSYSRAIAILREIGPDRAIEIDPRWKELRKKAKAIGFGYCVRKGSKVLIPAGNKNIEDLEIGDFVYSYDDNLQPCIRRVIDRRYMGVKPCYRIYWQGGRGNSGHLDLTGDHLVRQIDGSYIRVDQLGVHNERLLAMHRSTSHARNFLRVTGIKRAFLEYRIIYEQFYGYLPECVHHKDGNSLNDHLDNLEGLDAHTHGKLHPRPIIPLTKAELRMARTIGINKTRLFIGRSHGSVKRALGNHWVKKVKKIGNFPTYDIEVEDTHNFIANEICVHNCYGMGYKKFRLYARDNYDMHLTDEEAQQSRINYFQMYPLEGWHNRQRQYARLTGYVRSIAGRMRRLPLAQQADDNYEVGEALRQAINSPVQSFASDINLMVLLQMRDEFPRNVFQPTLTVHDSIIMEVRNDYVEKVARRIEEIMRRPKLFDDFKIKLSVPIEGETKVGAWGSGVSLEKWQ